MIRPGKIHMADFVEAGPYPVIALSREKLNRSRYVLVVVGTAARLAVPTFHLAHENFDYYGIARPDRPDVVSEEALLKDLPKTRTIVRTVLDTQSSYTDAKRREM